VLPTAKSIIVLLKAYWTESLPPSLEGHFGRCYLDDDRVTQDGMATKLKAFRGFLREHGIASKVPFNLPHRLAAARAGLGTFGKNCLLYANRVARRSSWVLPIAFVVDREFVPDEPTARNACPDWCRNACVAACPTRALKGNGTIDPRRCISYLSYYGEGITPIELREAMGMYVYGCDRCQNVCPRNSAWTAQELPPNRRVQAKANAFDLAALLHMDRAYFEANIWPHMFYMSADDIWRWKMNAARAMGNSLDERYVSELARAFRENDDERVRGMIAWALGRIGGDAAIAVLDDIGRIDGGPSERICAEIETARVAASAPSCGHLST
ncbi:MAG TPA: 4Fe-4S double cluster binding domain-containing protein, partial [Spirochaetota bacterium]|nr:4Fe-4S double cluster binding domain-containing protein [Spirochaetota bacterium]